MVESLRKVTLSYEPFKADEILRVSLEVERNVPYISSEWPSRVILWLSRRYHVTNAYYAIQGDSAFLLKAFIVCDKDFFRQCSYNSLCQYVRQLVK